MELVVLVDEQNREIGTADKATVHTKNTPLHRGFSLFLFRASEYPAFPKAGMNEVRKDGRPAQGNPALPWAGRMSFNTHNELLLTQRAPSKKTFPGVWTNTLCGHPGLGETVIEAAKRRLEEELGIACPPSAVAEGNCRRGNWELVKIEEVAPYRYKFVDQNGVVENEICPILVAYTDEEPEPNPQEIADWKWVKWGEFLREIKKNPQKYSPWCVEEGKILEEMV